MQIGQNDLERKLKQAQKFLEKREQVRITLALKGRQKGRPEGALEFLLAIHNDYMAEFGKLTKDPTMQNLSLTYNPKSK